MCSTLPQGTAGAGPSPVESLFGRVLSASWSYSIPWELRQLALLPALDVIFCFAFLASTGAVTSVQGPCTEILAVTL